ncbi:MAG: TonB-dependent receptor plug domain-containing protein [Marinifilum sp.]|nr:TonB-dependent receptor plug domain-containing protein [Marinifilum sp.]
MFQIRNVNVSAEKLLKKEEAGITKSEVDTIAMMEAQHLSLSELISVSTPIYIKHYGRGTMATASFRGTAPSHTQVQWNGISLNSPMLGMVDFSLIPVWFFDDAELYHGGGSLKEGSGALGGTIALSNQPMDWRHKFSATALGAVASFSTYDAFTALSFGDKKWQSKTKAFYSDSDNDFEYVNKLISDINPHTGKKTYPTLKNNAPYQNYGVLQEFYFRLASNQVLSLRGWLQHTVRTIPTLGTYEGGVVYNPITGQFDYNDVKEVNRDNEQDNKAFRTSFSWKLYGENSQLRFNSGINYEDNNYLTYSPVRQGDQEVSKKLTMAADSYSTSWYNQLAGQYQWQDYLTLEGGIDFQYHDVNSNEAQSLTGYDENRWLLSSHATLSGTLGERATWLLLLRQEMIDRDVQPILGHIGMEWQPIASIGWVVKGSVACNNHYPTLNDLYFLPGGNVNLRNEESLTSDVGMSYTAQNRRWYFKSSVTGFYSDVNDWILWLPTQKGYWTPINIDKVISKGLEADLTLKRSWPKSSLTFHGAYSLTHALNFDKKDNWGDESYGKQLPYIPKHSGNASITLDHHHWQLGYFFSAYSERFTTSSNEYTTDRDRIYPYLMNDIMLKYKLKIREQRVDIQFKVYNLFDETYRNVLQRPMPLRNYSLVLKYQFHN